MIINLTKNHLMLGIAVLCAAAIDYAFFTSLFHGETPKGLTLFLVQATIVAGMYITAQVINKKLFSLWYVSGFFALLGSLAAFVTSAKMGAELSAGGIVISNAFLFISFINNENLPETLYALLTWTILHPLEKLVQAIARIGESIAAFWKRLSTTNRATVIGIPVAVITLLLLASTNPILESIINKIKDVLPEYFFGHIVVVFFGTLAALLVFIAASLPETHHVHHTEKNHLPIAWELVLTLINVPLVIFTFLQIVTYTMEAHGNTVLSMSNAENAIRSVSDAIVATLLCGIFVLIAWAKTEKKKRLLGSTGVITGALALLAIVSETRIFAYINEFGFTPSRIVGVVGMGALLLAIVGGGIALIVHKETSKPIFITAMLGVLTLTILPFSQLDLQSVKYNLARATEEQPFDSNQMAKLSAEAIPLFLTAIDEGVPMKGMMVDCKANRSNYARFLRIITPYATMSEGTRWMNVTLPEKNIKAFFETHTVPATCTR